MATYYEIQLLPPKEGSSEPWRASVRISTSFGPDNQWTSPPIALKADNEEDARKEARAHVTLLKRSLNRFD